MRFYCIKLPRFVGAVIRFVLGKSNRDDCGRAL
ncbi:MAG: stage V sporulation protein M [Eubacteriales bacterium]|nr:stage V sporulation protein M [Eubacteriales bacterium]